MILRIHLHCLFYMINLLYIIVIGKPLESSSLEYDANSTDTNTLSSKYFKTNGQKNNKIHHKPMQGSLLNYVQGMTDATKLKHVTIRNTIQRGKEKDNIQYGLEDAPTTMETWTEVIDRVITNENEEHSSEIEESTTKLDSETSITNNLECTASDALKNVNVTNTGTDWIYLVWNITCELENTTISIKIQICEDHECIEQEFDVNKTQEMKYNATDLNPCTEYNLSVTVIMGRNSSGYCLKGVTSTDITTIEDVNNVYVQNYTTHNINISWTPPKRYAKCLQNYSIYKCEMDNCSHHGSTNKTNYMITELEPCTCYTFQIQIQSGNATSNGYFITQQTQSSRIGPPLNPIAKPGNHSLYINWEKPIFGSECLQHYRVTIEPFTQTETPTGTSIEIHNLRACMKYDIYINAVTKSADDGPQINFEGITALSAPNSLVTYNDTQEPIITKHNVSILWNVQNDERNNCSMSLQTICEYVSVNGQGYDPVNKTHTILDIGPSNTTLNVTVKDLSPFTTYNCWAMVFNEAGYEQSNDVVNLTTSEDVPSAPTLDVTNITESQFSLVWEKPFYLAGILNDVELVLDWKPMYSIPDWCVQNTPNPIIKNINASIFHHKHSEGLPFVNYTAKIRVKTAAGWSPYSELKTFNTKISVPGKISNLSCVIQGNKKNSSALNTILSWGLPCSLNGMLDLFSVTVYGERINHSPHSFSILKNVTNHFHVDHLYTLNLNELKGEYNYTIQVSAKVLDVGNFGMSDVCGFMYPAGIPPQPDDDYIKSITIDPYKARRSASTVALLLPLFPDINGDIKYYAIMVSKTGYGSPSNSRLDLNISEWPNVSTWEEAMLNDFSIPYQATRPRWTPSPNDVIDYGHMKAVKYILGEDSTCREISSNTDKRLYCNGPLKPDTYYDVRMRAFTSGGFTDSKAFVIKTNSELSIPTVIGIVFGILLLGILTTMMLLVRKCSPQVVFRKFMQSEMTGSPVPTPFTRKKFISHCQQLIDNPGKLSNEFKLLQTLSLDLQMPTNSACLQANKKKNRYFDILPYDFSRVKLKVIENDPNTDYINASFIRGYTAEDEYIACQGPKEETTYDFWRMIDECDVKIIVMLTELIEQGKEKCHQYFPKSRETFKYEEFTIRCSSELDFRTYTQRTLIVEKNENKRSVTHLQFKDWPDHDVPEDFDPMINFCQIMRKHTNVNKGLVVVHCSAGIGRTGTLIAIDILLQHLRDNKKIDVFGTVYRLRHNRINMVQREPQYAYKYNCIKQVLKNPYFSKTYKPPPVDPINQNISKTMRETSSSSLVSNFECNSM